MTSTTEHLTIDYPATETPASSDPRIAMTRSIHAATAVASRLRSSTSSSSTPCSDWSALDVARHMIAVIDRATAGATGRSLDELPELADVDLVNLRGALAQSGRAFRSAWTDDTALTSELEVPWGTFPGAAVLAVYSADLLVHTWDLAVAMKVELNWPEDDVAASLQMAKVGFPDDTRENMPFGPVVRLDPDAPVIEHLAGWVGRDVGQWRSRG